MTSVVLSAVSVVATVIGSIFLLFRTRVQESLLLFLLLILSAALFGLDAYILANPQQFYLKLYVQKLEAGLPLVALLYSAFFCRAVSLKKLSIASRVLLPFALLVFIVGLTRGPEAYYFSPDFGEESLLFLTDFGFVFYLMLMSLLVLAMVQLERTLSALSQFERWRVKYEIIGTCVLLGISVVYYSQSLLYRSLDMGMADARSFALLLAAGLTLYSRFSRDQGEQIRISRAAAYRSLVLFVVGAYLIGLGLLGEGMRYLDLPAQRNVLLVIAIVSAVLVAILFMSETLRRKIKVHLHKNFYQSKYDYRQHWTDFTAKISGADSLAELQQTILITFCETFACKGAAFYLLDSESGEYSNSSHFEFRRDWRTFKSEDPLIVQLAEKDWIIDLQHSPEELEDTLVDSLAEAGASLVIPLLFDNELIGFIVLTGKINTAEKYSYEDYDLMRMIARQATAAVHGLSLSEQLSIARELAAIGKVSTFVLHDLKNQVSGLSLMLDNAKDYIDEPEFQQDMLETVDNTVSNMKGLIARLKNLKEKPQLLVLPVDLKKIVDDAVETTTGNIEVSGESVRIDADEEEIYKVVLNLLLNAVEASTSGTAIQVQYGLKDDAAFVTVSDTGCGMSVDFISNRLFKPFETTKKHGFGIGLYQCKQIMESHSGSISVTSREGEGTSFTLRLPSAPDIVAE
ncbi:PEP-CTERM system histidine kinase PrsK [Deltaproteobacteria bacterium]|nr:PEP-CTERM system histidine kinase PrsK [Deltaproteobacteria bacterium]